MAARKIRRAKSGEGTIKLKDMKQADEINHHYCLKEYKQHATSPSHMHEQTEDSDP